MKFHLPHSLYKALLAVVCVPCKTLAGDIYAQNAHYVVYEAAEAPITLQWDCTGTEPAVWDTEQPNVWKDETGQETTYSDGAKVIFGEGTDINKHVSIAPEEVSVESVEITGTGYSFEGGNMVVTEQIKTAATVRLENTLIMGSTTSPLTIDVADGTELTLAYLGTTFSESNGTHMHEHGSFTKVGGGTLHVNQDIHGFITNATILGGTLELGKGVTMDIGSNEILGGTLENVQMFVTGDITRTLTGVTVTAHNVIKSANGTQAALLKNVKLHAGTEAAYATLQNVVFAGVSSLTGYITFESTHAQQEIGVATGSTLNVSNATFELRGIASGSKVLIVNKAVSNTANGLLSGITLPDNISGLGGSITGWETVKFVYSGVAVNPAAVNSSVAGTVTLLDKHDGNLYWDGSENGTWDAITGNWSLVAGKDEKEVFTALSNVYFGSGDIAHKNISVIQDSVVMNLDVSDGDYTFTGGRIAVLNNADLHPGTGSVTFNDQLVVQGNLDTSGSGNLALMGAVTVGKNAEIETLNTILGGDMTVGGSLTINAGSASVAGSLSIDGNITAKAINIAVYAGENGGKTYNDALVNVTGNLTVEDSNTITIGGTAEQHYLGVVKAGYLTVNTQEHHVYFDHLHVGELTVGEGAYVHVHTSSAAVSLSSSDIPVINLHGTLALDAHDVTYDRGYKVLVQDDAATLSFGTGCTIANMEISGKEKEDKSGFTNLAIAADSRSATIERMKNLGNLSVSLGSVTVKNASDAVHGALHLNNSKLNLAEGSNHLMAEGSGIIELTNASRLNIGSTTQNISAANKISLSSASSITGAAEGSGLVFANGASISYAEGDNAISANMTVGQDHTLNIVSTQSNSSLDISGKLIGSGAVQLYGAGTVALSATNPFSGSVTVGQDVTLSLENALTLSQARVILNDGGTLSLDTDTAVYLNSLTLNNGATLSFSTISDTDDFSANHAALHVTKGEAIASGTLNISFDNELDTLRTYNLLTGLRKIDGITLNVLHNGVALHSSQYKVDFDAESGLLYIQTLMGNVWEGQGGTNKIWSTTNTDGNWCGGSNYDEKTRHKTAIFGDLNGVSEETISVQGPVNPGEVYFVADSTKYTLLADTKGLLAKGTIIHKEGDATVQLGLKNNITADTALGDIDVQAGTLEFIQSAAVSGTITVSPDVNLDDNVDVKLVLNNAKLMMGSYTVSGVYGTLCGVTMDADGISGTSQEIKGSAEKLLIEGNADLTYLTLKDVEAKGNVTLSYVTLTSSAGTASHLLENVTIGKGVEVNKDGSYTLSGMIAFEGTLLNKGTVTLASDFQAELGKAYYESSVNKETGKAEYVYKLINLDGGELVSQLVSQKIQAGQVYMNGVNLANGLNKEKEIVVDFTDNGKGSLTLSVGNKTADGTSDGSVGMPQWDDDWGKTEKAPGLSRLYVGTNAAKIELAADYYKYSSIVNVGNAAKVNNGKAISVTLSSVAAGELAAGNRIDDKNNVIAADHEVWIEDRSEFENVIAGSANLTDQWTDTFQTAATHILVNNSDFKKDPDKAARDNPDNPDEIKNRANWAKKFIIGGSRWTSQGIPWGNAASNWQPLVAESYVTVLNGEIYTIFGGSCGGYYETEKWEPTKDAVANQYGTAHVFIEGGRIGEIFGAGMRSTLTGTQVVNGRTRAVELVLTGGKLGGRNLRVFGGGERGKVIGDIYVRMEGNAEIISRLLGGSNAGYVQGNIEMDLISGKAFRVDAAGLGWKEVYTDGSVWEDRAKIEGNVLVNLYSAFQLGHGSDFDLKAGIYGGMESTNYVDLIGDCTSTLHFAESATYNLGRLNDDGYTASVDSIIVTGFDRFTLEKDAHAVLALGYFDIDMDTTKPLYIIGNGVVEVIGHGENFGRDIELQSGATLKVSTSSIKPETDKDVRTITVTSGTTLDLTGYPVASGGTTATTHAGLNFNTTICGDGVDGKGAIFKGTVHEKDVDKTLSAGMVSLPIVTLTGNASVGVMNHEVLHMSSNALGETILELNGNTFTKQGLGTFVARNVKMSKGTVLVHQGDFYIDKGSLSSETDIVMADETSLYLNSVKSEEGNLSPSIRALSGAGKVILNDTELTLNTTSNSSYQDLYMDGAQSYDQFMSTTGFAYAVFSGTISEGSGASRLIKTGDGVHYISGSNNTYSGGTSISEGRLYLLGTSTQSKFDKGTTNVAFGVAGTGAITWAGEKAELYLGHDTHIYNQGSSTSGVMTIGVEGAPNNKLEEFIGIRSKGENNNNTPQYVKMNGEDYVEIDTHNLNSIAVDAIYADGTEYKANTAIDRNKMLLVKGSDWESAKTTTVTGFFEAGYNEAIYSGVLSDGVLADSVTVASKLHKVGVGTLVLDQTNTYTDGTEISGGTLRLRGWGTLGNNEKKNGVTVQNGATLMFTHNSGYGNEPTSADNDITIYGNGDARWQNHAATDNDTAALISAVGPAVRFTLSGDIDGSGNILHSGEGVLVLNGDSSYTGGTYVSRGTIEVQSATGLGATAEGKGSVTIESDADMRITVEDGYTQPSMVTELAADVNDIQGDVLIAGTAKTERILHMEGNGYNAASTTLNEGGILLLNGDAIGGAPVSAHSGMLTGSGTVVVSDAAATGASATFNSMVEYTGDLHVEGDKASIEVQNGSFHGGSIHVAGQQASVSIGGNISIEDGESLHLSSTGSAHAQVNEGNNTAAGIYTAGTVSVASGAELSVSNQETEYFYNLKKLQEATSIHINEKDIQTGAQPVFHAIGDKSIVYNLTYDSNIAINRQASGAIQATGGLILDGGSTYTTVAAHISLMGGRLTLDAMENNLLILNTTTDSDIDSITLDTQLVLFSDVGSVSFVIDNFTAEADTGIYFTKADRYFTGCDLIDEFTLLVYDANARVVYLHQAVPEPTTATLSLLALAALAARRRRR